MLRTRALMASSIAGDGTSPPGCTLLTSQQQAPARCWTTEAPTSPSRADAAAPAGAAVAVNEDASASRAGRATAAMGVGHRPDRKSIVAAIASLVCEMRASLRIEKGSVPVCFVFLAFARD